LYTILNENAAKLSRWAASLQKVSDQATYFNFLDSHDGIGLMAVNGILDPEEIEMMALKMLEHGGFISYKTEGGGVQSPYELNITWFSAVNNEDADEPAELQIRRYLASRAIALVLMGVPGVYLHGLLGSKNDAELVIEQKQTRSINRKNIKKDELLKALENPASSTYQVTVKLIKLIRRRIKEKAFHPNSPQKVLDISDAVFTVLRSTVDGAEHILSLINVTSRAQSFKIRQPEICGLTKKWIDVISKNSYSCINGEISIEMNPYQIIWLKAESR